MKRMKPSPRPWLPALALLLAAATALPAGAQIRRWVDERGVVHYSNAEPNPSDRVASPITEVAPAAPLTDVERVAGQC